MYSILLKSLFVPKKNILMLFEIYGISLNSLRKRTCWKCHAQLDFWEFLDTFKEEDYLYAVDLWQEECIEFYCCKCFDAKKAEIEEAIKPDKYVCPGKIFTFQSLKLRV